MKTVDITLITDRHFKKGDRMPPRYIQIRDELVRRIKGDFYSDRQLPSEILLAREFQVNRNTLRRSIGELEKSGLRVKG